MSKLIKLVLTSLFLVGCMGSGNSDKKVLRVYMPSEYIDDNTIYEFEDMFNVKVIMENFESNEQMYTKLLAGNEYDVLIPSDYMIDRLIQEDQLQSIDSSKILNLEFVEEKLLNPTYDENNDYSVPYFYGSVGILYDKEKINETDLQKEGWNIYFNEKYNNDIYFYDSERDAFMIALKALGYSMNTSNMSEVDEAYEWLTTMSSTMSPVYVMDTVIESMLDANKAMAIMYSGDAAFVMSENENMGFYMPDEGTNIWVDAMVIPKTAKEVDLAHEWINFMLDYDIASMNSEMVGYTSPVTDVFAELSGKDGIFFENEAYTPRLDGKEDETFIHNEDLRKAISDYWIKVKAK